MEFQEGIRGYEGCISPIRRQKDQLKKQATDTKGDSHDSSWNIGTTQLDQFKQEPCQHGHPPPNVFAHLKNVYIVYNIYDYSRAE
jgi:hypothetical protein